MKMYTQLTKEEKDFATYKIALKIRVSEGIVKELLLQLNPPVKITEKNIALFDYSWSTIQKKIKNYL